jgi:hypothetical protein
MAPVVSTVIYPVKDLAQATTLFSAVLGVAPSSEAPYYVGFQVDGQDIGLDPNGHGKGMTGPVPYVEVDDITQRLDPAADHRRRRRQAGRHRQGRRRQPHRPHPVPVTGDQAVPGFLDGLGARR